ncbi:hypothetical protein BVG19_g2794 [[Candida] boidinii]|nr:hypothetical protein BVG19_g2794 [[Candida] boidinii]OWB52863.1 hypothetical protein B5S27_g4446 [[Candida] boidinii]OWB67587.1 hypothetical protein B5S30_g2949 [[Candida] boidinii]
MIATLRDSQAFSQYGALLKSFLFSGNSETFPALSTGLVVFLILVYIYSSIYPEIVENYSLAPSDLLSFKLNNLSTYPLFHENILHLLFNVVSLYKPLSEYERFNGTVHTGIVLNTLAAFTGVVYSIIGFMFYPNVKILGSSGWCFSFFAFFSYYESFHKPALKISSNIEVPTTLTPFIILILMGFIVPNSSFIGHLIGIFFGFLLALGPIEKITEPPFQIVQKIEGYLAPLINLIPSNYILYVKESDIISKRHSRIENTTKNGGGVLGIGTDLPVFHSNSSKTSNSSDSKNQPAFKGEGNVLGSTEE